MILWLWMWTVAMASAQDLLDRALEWRAVNDDVMGGVSSGRAVRTPDALKFEGAVSLENDGGFASIRTLPADLGLEGLTGFRVRLRGDGRAYDLTVRRADLPIRGGSWRARLQTTGEVQEIALSLRDFSATAFGRPVAGAPPLVGAGPVIDSVGFLVGEKQAGPFALEVFDLVPVFGSEPSRDPPARQALIGLFEGAFARGVPAFNQGEPGRCADVYAVAVEAALRLAPGALATAEQEALQAALARSLGEPPTDAAWTLRRAIDAVLESP